MQRGSREYLSIAKRGSSSNAKKLAELPDYGRVTREVLRGRFDEVLPGTIESTPTTSPATHPCSCSQIPSASPGSRSRASRKILASDRSELFLNFDSDGLVRILMAEAAGKAEENLTSIFGDGAGEAPQWSTRNAEACSPGS